MKVDNVDVSLPPRMRHVKVLAPFLPWGRENKQEKEMEKMPAPHLSSATTLKLSERD